MDRRYLDENKIKDLIEKSERDYLTGIYSRETFYARVSELVRAEEPNTYVVCTLDIDKFKIVNDLFSAAEGDRLLRFIATKLQEHFGPDILAGRLNADNFAILLRQDHVHGHEQEITDDIQGMVKDYPLNIQIIIRCGFYYIHDPQIAPGLTCDRANLAMQEIKGSYSRRFAVYDEKMRSRILKEQEIINEMNKALDEGEFAVFYQPKFNMEKHKIIGSEALVRWIHPEKGMISPGDFIPIFEKNGFIATLDYYVWEHVCMDIAEWVKRGYSVCPVSVNVSRAELYNLYLVEQLENLVKRYDVPISLLQLEITETAYTENPEQLIDTITRLREKGFVILMDDFGSGYSSLNTLKDVPVDVLKIDLKFLYNMDRNYKANYILKSIVQMAKRLELVVIAEGVETSQQADFLKSIGCVRAQGYLFAKPMDEPSFGEFLANPTMILAEDEDEIEGLINIDDIMSKIHREDEIEWYRAAVIQMKGILAQYELNTDTFILFDMPLENESKELVKVEIPNFSRVVKEGKYFYPADIDMCIDIVRSRSSEPFQVRAHNINHISGYRWYEVQGRFLQDAQGENELYSCVVRDITERKANEAVMSILTSFEENVEVRKAMNESLAIISHICMFDCIILLFEVLDKRTEQTGLMWRRDGGSQPLWSEDSSVNDLIYSFLDDISDKQICVYQEEEFDHYQGIIRDYLLENHAKTTAVSAINISGEYKGVFLYINCKESRDFMEQDRKLFMELTKCMASNLQKSLEQKRREEIQSLYRYAFQNSDYSLWEWNISTKLLYRSKAVRHKQGLSEYVENIPDAFVDSGIVAAEFAEDYCNMYRSLAQGRSAACTFKSRHSDGTYKWMRIAYSVIFNDKGKAVKAVGFGEDVNAFCDSKIRICRNVQLRKMKRGELLCTFAGDVTAREVPEEYRELFERSFDYAEMIELFRRGERFLYQVYQMECEYGEQKWVEASTYLEANAKNNHVIFQTFFSDMTEQQKWSGCTEFEEENDRMRVFSADNFRKITERCLAKKRNSGNAALIVIKLKEFEILKTIFGKRYWEDVMFSLSAVIKASKPLHSAIGRIEKNVFCVYVHSFENRNYMYYYVERLTRMLQTFFEADRNHYILGPEIGMAFADERGFDYEELLKQADRFLEETDV